MDEPYKFIAVKFIDCVYLSQYLGTNARLTDQVFYTGKYKFDVQHERTYMRDWMRFKEIPKKLIKRGEKTYVNFRYELKDMSLASERIPMVLSCEMALIDPNGYWENEWKPEWIHLESLYERKCDEVLGADEEVPFEICEIVEFDCSGYKPDINYPTKGSYREPDKIDIDHIQYQLMDRIIFPQPALITRPCKIPSDDAYRIVRQHIRQHINPERAKITSDYDFCFSVSKNISLAKPFETKHEDKKSNGKSYRPPRIKTILNTTRTAQVFEMTPASNPYKGYTVMHEFMGDNEEELKRNIDDYLEQLMSVINAPIVECPYCNGTGVKDGE